MNEHLISNLVKLKNEIFHFNLNDSLIDLNFNSIGQLDLDLKNTSIELDFSLKIKKIYQESENFNKDSGICTLMISFGYLKWQYKDKEILTPIFLIPITYKLNKISNILELKYEINEISLNPFLVQHFRNEFDILINENQCLSLFDFENIISNHNFQYEILTDCFIGNFHFHRYQILRDIDNLLNQKTFSIPFQKIFGCIDENKIYNLILPEMNLLSSDVDQFQAIKSIEKNDVVLQGPPGTGKSQVILNLIGKVIYQNKKVLLVSEKKAALDVIEKKLFDCNLDAICFVFTERSSNSEFITKLKESWNRLESIKFSKSPKLYLTNQRKELLNNELNQILYGNLIGGLNYYDLTKNYTIDEIKDFTFIPLQIQLIDFYKYSEEIKNLFDIGINKIASVLNQNYLILSSNLEVCQKIDSYIQLTEELKSIFKIEKIDDFVGLKKKLVLCQLIQNETKKHYFNLINPNSKESKKYQTLRKKYFSFKNKLLKYNQLDINTIKSISFNELISYKANYENATYFKKIKIKNKLSNIFKVDKSQIKDKLDYFIELKQIELKYLEIKLELSAIGIHAPENDFVEIDTSKRLINQYEWEEYFNLKERDTILSFYNKIENWNNLFKVIFNDNTEYLINNLNTDFQNNKESLIKYLDNLRLIPNQILKSLKLVDNFNDYEKLILKSNLVNFENQFPELSKFKTEDLDKKIRFLLDEELKEQFIFRDEIIENLARKFNQYHEILLSNTAKLTSEEKNLKNILKTGKAILVKEFNKKRSHLTPREIYQSDARIWIDVLMPIFMCNPLVLSKIFPIEKDLFDVVIFDEAGQIPFYNALGAIQRGRRVFVSGDDQQLSPNYYFKTGNKEIISLLDNANYYYDKKMLKHHYRSEKAELISFSNRYFYNNELKVFPKHEINSDPAIQWHYCQNGIYHQNQNEIEALKVIEVLKDELNKGLSIGVVTFSKSQLDCIINNIPVKNRIKIDELITENLLFFKPLENIQGDECDILIISLGYAKNANNEFKMQFGPLNHSNGSKRLNVLFSRAKQKIVFISSVNSTDFKLSTNESVNLLKKYIENIEIQNNNPKEIQFSSDVIINNLISYFDSNNIDELLTYHSVMTKRGWKLKYK